VAHACNPSYTGGRDQEDHSLKPARANSSRNPISKKPFTKKKKKGWWWSGSRWALSSSPTPQKKKATDQVLISRKIFCIYNPLTQLNLRPPPSQSFQELIYHQWCSLIGILWPRGFAYQLLKEKIIPLLPQMSPHNRKKKGLLSNFCMTTTVQEKKITVSLMSIDTKKS
jgi:hypothetical protein